MTDPTPRKFPRTNDELPMRGAAAQQVRERGRASEAVIAEASPNACNSEHLEGRLIVERAATAETPMERTFRDSRTERKIAGTNEITKPVIAGGRLRD